MWRAPGRCISSYSSRGSTSTSCSPQAGRRATIARPPAPRSAWRSSRKLVATAIANADSRDQLAASRSRVLSAGDEARRRLVRDLHDGAQQALVHSVINLRLARRAVGSDADRAESLLADALAHVEQGMWLDRAHPGNLCRCAGADHSHLTTGRHRPRGGSILFRRSGSRR
jgi:signal transduction histidine kinase